MADVFGKHQPKIPYQPIADLLAQYRRRDPDKLAIVDLDQETSISFGALERAVTDIAAALSAAGRRQGQPRAAAVRRDAREAPDLARDLAARRGGRPAQYRAQREADRRPRRGRRSGARAGAQGARRRGAAGGKAVHQVRPLHAERGRRRPPGRFLPHHGARHRAGEPAGAQRGRRYRLHLLHLRHHQPAEDRGL